MTNTRYGVTIPLSGPLHAQRDQVVELVDLGYTDVWSSEADGTDGFTPLVLASQWAPELRLGVAIVPVFTRGPALLAQSAAALAEAAPGRFVLGIGASSNVIVERWNGLSHDRPYQRCRDTLAFLTAAFTGDKVTEDYDTFSVKGFRLGRAPEVPPTVLLAALREGMLGLAGRASDGAILNWLSADDVATVAPHVHAGGEGKELVARLFVVPTADADVARSTARFAIAAYLNVPVYAEFHRWLGRGEQLTPMWDAWAAGDRKAALAAIPDSVVDDLIIHGDPAACREHVDRYHAAGIDTSALAIMPVPGVDTAQVLRDLSPSARR